MADYPISNVTRRIVYTGSAGVGPYAFNFEVLLNTDLHVYKNNTLLTLTTDYTVTISPTLGTGSVTLVSAATGSDRITIVGARAVQRTTDFTTGGDFFANTLNDELDSQTILIQQVAETSERGIRAPVTDPTNINMILPINTERANKFMSFDSSGNPQAIDSLGVYKGNWASGTSYKLQDIIKDTSNNNIYICTSAHTSSGSQPISSNTDVSKWSLLVDAASATSSASAAASSASAASTSATNASNSATSASNSATAASNSATAASNSATSASNYASNSSANASAAATSATNASNSASAASTSATNAASSANAAATSASQASAVALGNEPVRHSVRPSLLLDFANTKQLDPRITFTRASTATYYDGKTTAKAEENLLTYSEQFDSSNWNKTASAVTSNSTSAPDGNTTADLLYATVTGAGSYITQQFNTGGSASVFSVYAKSQNKSVVWLYHYTGANYGTYYVNLADGTTQTVAGSSATGTLTATSIGGGWYRISVVFPSTFNGNANFGIGVSDAKGSLNVTANATDGLYIWGAQLEQRSSVTAYTATTSAPITNYIPALQTAASGVARFDHNPTTGESLGLLIEESRTNLFLRSQDLSLNWTVSNSTATNNQGIAPDGTLTAALFVPNTSNLSHALTQGVLTVSTAYTLSGYFKYAGLQYIAISNSGASAQAAVFDLINGTITATGASATATIQNVGNGWYRCTCSFTAAFANASIYATNASTTALNTFAGDGWNGYYVWGFQAEAGAFATSYIPTTSATVTRAADAASMTGTNFSSWYRTDEGTLYAEGITASGYSTSSNYMIASIGDGAANQNQISLYRSGSGNTLQQLTSSSNAVVANLSAGIVAANSTDYKLVTVSKKGDFAFDVNANIVQTNGSGATPINVSQLSIGNWHAGTSASWNSTIKKLAFYPKRLTNSELQGLTTV